MNVNQRRTVAVEAKPHQAGAAEAWLPVLGGLQRMLTPLEAKEFLECERKIRAGLETFREVGEALAVIKEKRLYRVQFKTFEDYCREHWNMTARRARQLSDASDVVRNLLELKENAMLEPRENGEPVLPVTESQARPLTGLPKAEQREAWREAVASAPRDDQDQPKITAKHIEAVVARRTAPAPVPVPKLAVPEPEAKTKVAKRRSQEPGDENESALRDAKVHVETALNESRLVVRELKKVKASQINLGLSFYRSEMARAQLLCLAICLERALDSARKFSRAKQSAAPAPMSPQQQSAKDKAAAKAEQFVICREPAPGAIGAAKLPGYRTNGGWTTEPKKARKFEKRMMAEALADHGGDVVTPLSKALRRAEFKL